MAPALRRGDRATCLYLDAEVIVTSWSDGRIPWPRCQRPGERGGSGLLVDEELARAVRLEAFHGSLETAETDPSTEEGQANDGWKGQLTSTPQSPGTGRG
jgi:hypothetical protein